MLAMTRFTSTSCFVLRCYTVIIQTIKASIGISYNFVPPFLVSHSATYIRVIPTIAVNTYSFRFVGGDAVCMMNFAIDQLQMLLWVGQERFRLSVCERDCFH